MAFDMSRQPLRWFAQASAGQKHNQALGEPMRLTRREATSGIGGGLALLRALPALAQTTYAGMIEKPCRQ
jgi:hypothetical protein